MLQNIINIIINKKFFFTPDFGLSDLIHLHFSLKYYLALSLKSLQIPLWTNLATNGYPLLAQSETGTFYALNLLLFSFFSPAFAFNLTYLINFFLILIFTFLSARKIGQKKYSAIFSSLTFACSFYLTTQITHFDILQGITLLPVMFYLLISFTNTGRLKYLFLFSLALCQQLLVGFPQTVFISLCFFTFYQIFFLLKLKKKASFGKILLFTLAVTLALLMASIQLLPSWEFMRLSNRSNLSPKMNSHFSFPPKHIITFLLPFALGSPQDASYPTYYYSIGSVFWENSGYIGLLALLIALLSIKQIQKNKHIAFLTISVLFSFSLMLGKFSPFYFIFNFFPFNLFRVPSRFILITVFSLSLLSGFGLEIIYKLAKKYLSTIAASCLIISIIVINYLDVSRYNLNYHPSTNFNKLVQNSKITDYLKKQSKNKVYTVNAFSSWGELFAKEGWQHPEKYLFLNNELGANINLLWQIPSFNVYEILTTKRYQLLNTLIKQNFFNINQKQGLLTRLGVNILKQNNVSYIISGKEIINSDLELILTDTYEDLKIYLYHLTNTQKNYYFPQKITYINSIKDYAKTMSNDGSHQWAAVEKQELSKLETDSNCFIQILTEQEEERKLKTNCQKEQLLVINNSYYPDWKGYVDQNQTKLIPVNINQTGIIIPEGEHAVTLEYQPSSFYIGLAITLTSLAGWFLLFLLFQNKTLDTHRPYSHP